MRISTTLPQKVKNEPYIPTDEDIKKILDCSQDTMYEIPIILACYGMRRSEICALTIEDLEEDIIHINKAKVLNADKEWVIKSTKTTSSTRDIIIPMEVADAIKSQVYIYNGHLNNITDFLSRTQKELGLPHFSLHKLRHYFASKMSAMKVPDEDIMRMGGWQTDHVMKNIYRHAMKDENMRLQREASKQLQNALLK